MQNLPKSKYTMEGTEGTGEYVGVAATSRGTVAVRQFASGLFRVRVEPATPKGAEMIGRALTRSKGWKQPGDNGQNRFSAIAADSTYLSVVVADAVAALGVGDLKSSDLDYDTALRHVAGLTGVEVRTKVAKSLVLGAIASRAAAIRG